MKKTIILLLSLIYALSIYGQQKIAVYLAGDCEPGIKRVFGNKLVESINTSGVFTAADRTSDFIAEAKRQSGFDQSAAISESQIGNLGQQFGAQYVCLTEVLSAAGSNYVSTRFINAETNAIITTVEFTRYLGSVEDLANASAYITGKILSIAIINNIIKIDNLNSAWQNYLMKQQKEEEKRQQKEEEKREKAMEKREKATGKQQQKEDEISELSRVNTQQISSASVPADFDMILVKGGTFTMGSDDKKDAEKDEKPTHEVTLSDFYIGKTEVTCAQWKSIMGNYPSKHIGDEQLPACVNWLEIQEFIVKLNSKTGMDYRLLTEAEWEYAARGGNQNKSNKYSGSNNVDEIAWYEDNSNNKAHIVGSKKVNELGIYDMSGNVWEWCSDRYEKYSSSPQNNPIITDSNNKNRVLRGGSFDSKRQGVRVSQRFSENPNKYSKNIGFRLARNADDE
jgi:formylglycine-generating enzyme required for sulfatase activity